MEEKKGCANKFLDYCQQQEQLALTKEDKKLWKNRPNVLVGVLGQRKLGGYCYYPWHLAVIQIALLRTYYLYRQFAPENVLAIRADAILVKGGLPEQIINNPQLYHLKRVGLDKRETFNYQTNELKSPLSGEKREISLKKWLLKKESLQEFKKSLNE